MTTPKSVQDINAIAQTVSADSDFQIAFYDAFNKAFKPIFRTLTGLDFDPTVLSMYSKVHQTLISSAKESFEPIYQKQLLAKEQGTDSDIELHDYSAKSFILIGNTKSIKDEFKVGGRYLGRFNKALTVNGEKHAGWVFPLKFKPQILEILEKHKTKIDPFAKSEQDTVEQEPQQPLKQQPLF